MNFLISSAHAQEAAATATQQSPMASMIPFALIFVVFYFLMIKPQKKKLEQEKKFLTELSKGTEVFTKSGILGTIVGMTDKVFTLEIADNVKIKILKSQVGGAANTIFDADKTPAKAK
jgi:preprotein translocase subunit YajC